MWYKVNKIYVGTNLVRPSEITETYSITTLTTSDTDYNLYKSWYKITKVVISFNAYTTGSSSQYAWIFHRVLDADWNRFQSYLDMWASSTSQNKSYTANVQTSWSDIEMYQATNLWYANVKTKITYTLTTDSIQVVYWTNTYSRNFWASAKSVISTVFNSSTPMYKTRRDNYGNADDYTVTVTYKPS